MGPCLTDSTLFCGAVSLLPPNHSKRRERLLGLAPDFKQEITDKLSANAQVIFDTTFIVAGESHSSHVMRRFLTIAPLEGYFHRFPATASAITSTRLEYDAVYRKAAVEERIHGRTRET